jgi:hypothetical protein
MDAALRELLRRGWNLEAIAAEIGVSVIAAAARRVTLGLKKGRRQIFPVQNDRGR